MIEKTQLTPSANGALTPHHPVTSSPFVVVGRESETTGPDLGRHVLGVAAILFGILTLTWHDFNTWQQVGLLAKVPHREILACLVGAIEILGGLAIQWRETAKAGSIALGSIFLMFALLWIPRIIGQPLVYDGWGNFFEQFSQVAGALIVYGSFDRTNPERAAKIARFGYLSFAFCVVSFTLEQLLYLSGTARFVPQWIPPGQMFWAVTTTIAFALAAIALFTGRSALLASRLLTAMIVGFGLLIWLPAPFIKLFSDSHINWAGNAENLAIAGAAWIVADFLAQQAEVE
jgi:uncharacterized membrane protein YphA (DoxX/SURF4 family)